MLTIFPQLSYSAHQETDLLDLDLTTLMTLEIDPAADASAEGLSEPLAGGFIADGGRVGVFGTQPIMDSAFSVTSFTDQAIEDLQVHSIGDLLQYSPTVRVTRGFGNFQQAYWIRGLPVFSDDMDYNGLYGILPRQYLAAQLIERVEVLHGANALLNGAAPNNSGLGGSVNALPKRAPKRGLSTLEVGAHSGGETTVAMDIARRFNEQKTGVRFNAASREGDTEVDGENQKLKMGIIGLDYRGDQLRVSADLGYQNFQLNATTPSIDIAAGLDIPEAPKSSTAIAQPWTYSAEKDVFGTLRAEYDINQDITAWVAAGAREGKEDSLLSVFLTVNNLDGDFSASRFDVVHEDHVVTGELGMRMLFNTDAIAHSLTLGLNGYQNKSKNAFIIYDSFNSNIYQPMTVDKPTGVNFVGGDLNNPNITLKEQSSSWVVADEMSMLNSHLLLTLGVRQQNIRNDNFDYNSGDMTSKYDESVVTPMLASVYKLNDQYSLYGNYIEGLQKGSIAPSSNGNGAVENAGESISPLRVKQVEMGLKFSYPYLGGSFSVYNIRKPLEGYSDSNRLITDGYETRRGAEFILYGEPVKGLSLFGGLSGLDSKTQGNEAIGVPNLQSNINLEWAVPNISGLKLLGQWSYTAAQYADAANTQKVPSWNRLDLGISYRIPINDSQIILRAKVENATDQDYWASAGGYPGAGYLTLGSPRTMIFSTSFSL